MPSDKRQRQRVNAAQRAAAARAAQQRRSNRNKAIGAGGAIIVVLAVIVLFVVQSTGTKKSSSSARSSSTTTPGTSTTAAPGAPPIAPGVPAGKVLTGATPCPAADGSSARTSHFAASPPMCITAGKQYSATFTTTEGTVSVALDTARTPGTVNNFVTLARYHYYDGSSLFRIDTGIDIIQGGAPTSQSASDPGPGYTIDDEPAFTADAGGNLHGPYTYKPGDLVMARASGPKSAAAQYFFVAGPAASALDQTGTYVVFGHVTAGLDVLQAIEKLSQPCPPTAQSCGPTGAPSKTVLVNSLTIKES